MNRGFRIVGALAMAFAIAHCGDSDVRVSTDSGVVPSPGTFNGSLSDGGTIRIEVGSIEEVAFTCDGEDIQETFTPPQPIDSDGTFNVKFEDGGRSFRVRGTFRDNNNVDGTIDDEANECDVSYDAFRGSGPVRTATPAPTPTNGVVTTPTATGGGPTDENTETPGGVTPTGPTPTGVTPSTSNSGPSPTNTPKGCPVAVSVVGNAGNQKVLDSGWTGLGHDATVVSEGKLTFTLDCNATAAPCGVCDVSGPIQNLNADKGDINDRRCSNDTSIKCTDNSACGSGTCAFFFGAPLPLAAGGITSCVVNQLTGPVSGTANVESGAFASKINLASKVALGPSIDHPCPTCDGADTPNDGKADGTCNGGARNGQKCDVNGVSPIPSFGKTSLDCPPSSFIGAPLSINLDGSSGTETTELTATSPNCTGQPGKKCFCPAAGTQPTQANACIDSIDTPEDDSICQPIGGNKGSCQNQPVVEQYCSPTETFRGCISEDDCPVASDSCVIIDRPCFLDNGVVGGKVNAVGKADPPDNNGVSNPTFAAVFCIPPVAQASINAAAGLPGLGRIQLPLVSQEIFSLPSP